jgi:hypothetical protein
MSRFLTDHPRPSSALLTSVLANFYREEFVKHQQCLEQQREFYSEHAITEVEEALARILSQLEQLCTKDDAEQVVSCLLRKFDVVTRLSFWSDHKNVH